MSLRVSFMADSFNDTYPPMFALKSEPLPMGTDLLAAIGELVVIWSRIETGLSMDISSMMQYPNIAALATEPPRSFKTKLTLWRRCVRVLYQDIEKYQALANRIQTDLKAAAKVRNHIIHGSWSLMPNDDGSFTTTNITMLRHAEKIARADVDLERIQGLLTEIYRLDGLIHGFIASKIWHAHLGLLKISHGKSPDSPAHPSATIDEAT